MIPVSTLFVFITVPLAIKSYSKVSVSKREGVPITNKLHLSFGLITILAMIFG